MPDALVSKYANEFVLEFPSDDRFLFRASDLYELKSHISPELVRRLSKCHIYLLGKRPRLWLQPDSVAIDAEFLRFTVKYRLTGSEHEAHVRVPRRFLPLDEVYFEASPYPHRELISRDKNGQVVAHTVLANYADFIPDLEQSAKDIEVVYVGKGLSKSAHDRLLNHSTLQQISLDINSNDPDAEVLALVYRFGYHVSQLGFVGVPVGVTGKVANKHVKACMNFKPRLPMQVSLVESSIISYFHTDRFNTHYVNWDKRAHKAIKAASKADFAAMEVVLDNTNIGGQRLFSQSVAPASVHHIIVDFRKLEGRSPFVPL
jgi:hypothetical protein